MHDGQICLPFPGGKVRLAHPHARYTHGLYRTGGGAMHVSAGLGTTFVPFRFAARPEATELVLRSVSPGPLWRSPPYHGRWIVEPFLLLLPRCRSRTRYGRGGQGSRAGRRWRW